MIWQDHVFNFGPKSTTRVAKFREKNWRGVNIGHSLLFFHCLLFVICGWSLFVVCCLSLLVICGCLSFVVVCHLSLFAICRCFSFVVVGHLSLFVICRCLSFIVVCHIGQIFHNCHICHICQICHICHNCHAFASLQLHLKEYNTLTML